jgi:hypothetical protein
MTTASTPILRSAAAGVVEPCGPTATIAPAMSRTARTSSIGTRSSGGAQRQNR